METATFDSNCLAETEAFLSAAYTPMKIGGRPEDSRARIARRTAGPLIVDRLDFGYTMAYDADCLNRVCLITLHDGTFADTTDGREEFYGPGETFLLAPHDRPYRGEVRAARYTITMFDPGLLGEVAGDRFRGPVELTGQRPVSREANRALGAAVVYVRDQVVPHADAGPGSLLVDTAARHLAAATLAALPHAAAGEAPGRLDGRDAGSDTLRRAIAYIESHAHLDIGLADIAAAVPVTPRAVQYAFRRQLDSTPLEYLRRVRLAGAHAELRRADPATSTVTTIAARWGFAHPGRFSAAYRRQYGCPPSATLHR
ncbi:AraC family transcriptional regulator [Streptomyces sp. NPDC089919]|uniref:helix-turn-helix transcriptional regulator n=1 Tax=Streptomyces sp. NPDC089919 TaxID=3155188 RepID=UPI0034351012